MISIKKILVVLLLLIIFIYSTFMITNKKAITIEEVNSLVKNMINENKL